MTLKWNGKDILMDVLRATKLGMDDTTAAIAQSAQGKVRRNTGRLQRNIARAEATVEGDEVVGYVGVQHEDGLTYALIEEIRHPYLRPAVDTEGQRLTANIRKHFK